MALKSEEAYRVHADNETAQGVPTSEPALIDKAMRCGPEKADVVEPERLAYRAATLMQFAVAALGYDVGVCPGTANRVREGV